MQQTVITIFSILIPLGALIFYLFNWLRADIKELRQDINTQGESLRQDMKAQEESLRQDIKTQGESLRQEMKTQEESLRQDIKDQGDSLRQDLKEIRQELKEQSNLISKLQATIETFFRLRVDPLPPPDSPGPDQVNQAA